MQTSSACLALALVAAALAPAGEEKPAARPPAPASSASPAPATGPPASGRWEPLPDFTDEFVGTQLDPAKWHATNPQWKGRQPGLFLPRNVTVSDGQLHIAMRREDVPGAPTGYHTYTCGAVKSRTTVLYGYFEVKARPMRSRGSSAFWFYHSTPQWWTEIDVFEIGAGAPGHQRKVHMNVHVFVTPADGKKHWAKPAVWEAPADLADQYRVYALEWDRERITWSVDGVVRRTLPNTHWHQPLHLNFDSETMPEWFGLPEEGTLPSTFSVEYVRAWKRSDAKPPAEAEPPRTPPPGPKP